MRSNNDDSGRRRCQPSSAKSTPISCFNPKSTWPWSACLGGLPTVTALRVAGILAAVLTPSWVSTGAFRRTFSLPSWQMGGRMLLSSKLIERMRDAHIEIGEHQREVSIGLKQLANGGRVMGTGLRDIAEQTLALRRQHHAAENVLDMKTPRRLDNASRVSSRGGRPARALSRFRST